MSASGLTVRQGDVIAGKYVVERVLGGGAMGVVVLAMHIDLQERRAIKLMSRDAMIDPQGVERFFREARAAVKLRSEHVARVHDMGRLPDQSPFIVLEYLEGSDLKHLIESRGPLPLGEAVRYLLQASEAIGEAHSLGIVHRDLKPANLFVTRNVGGDASIKVFDFGIAKLIGPGQNPSLTSTSSMLGTPLYMSPEQMRGAADVDGRTDIWALGAVLYCMLTGRTPFTGSTVTEICAAVIADPPKPPELLRPDIPPVVAQAILRCLEKKPGDRWRTVAELADVLRPFAADTPVVPTNTVPARVKTISMDEPALASAVKYAPREAAAREPAMSGPAATLGGSTAQKSWWSAQNSVASRSKASPAMLVAGLITGLAALGCTAFLLNRYGTSERSTVSLVSGDAPVRSVALPSASVSATIAASADVSVGATAVASDAPPPVSARASASTRAPIVSPPKTPAAVSAPPKDAFGRDRK
jgi:serine/threonine protein kinase